MQQQACAKQRHLMCSVYINYKKYKENQWFLHVFLTNTSILHCLVKRICDICMVLFNAVMLSRLLGGSPPYIYVCFATHNSMLCIVLGVPWGVPRGAAWGALFGTIFDYLALFFDFWRDFWHYLALFFTSFAIYD